MSQFRLYAYGSCGTCKKAVKYLDNRGIDYELIDITQSPPSVSELRKVLLGMEGNLKKLFNTSGQVYRSEGYSAKLKDMTEKDALSELANNGKLVKRPMILDKNLGVCGFKEDVWNKFFDKK